MDVHRPDTKSHPRVIGGELRYLGVVLLRLHDKDVSRYGLHVRLGHLHLLPVAILLWDSIGVVQGLLLYGIVLVGVGTRGWDVRVVLGVLVRSMVVGLHFI